MQGFAIIKVYPDKTKDPVILPPKELTPEQNAFLQSVDLEVNQYIGNKKSNSSSDLQTSLKK